MKMNKESFIYFNSNAVKPFYKLSNFQKCNIKCRFNDDKREYIFPSIEHCYVAHFVDIKTRYDLSLNGKYGTLKGLKYIYKNPIEVEKKIKYWSKKNNIGIIAKMVKTRYKGVLKKYSNVERNKIWNKILKLKFENEEMREVLLKTNDKILIEFGRISTNNSFYTGKVVDGKIVGNNYMGKKLMEIRDQLIK